MKIEVIIIGTPYLPQNEVSNLKTTLLPTKTVLTELTYFGRYV